MTDIEAVHNAQVVEEAQLATAAPSGGDPVPLGLLVFALGSTVLGISLLGYVRWRSRATRSCRSCSPPPGSGC